MIQKYEQWKDTLINSGTITIAPFNDEAPRYRYRIGCMDNAYEMDYDDLDASLLLIYNEALIPLFNGDLPHGERPCFVNFIYVTCSIVDSLVIIHFNYAFDDIEQAKEMAELLDTEEIYDTLDEDILYFLDTNED